MSDDRHLKIVPDPEKPKTLPLICYYGGGKEVVGTAEVFKNKVIATFDKQWEHLLQIPGDGYYSIAIMGVISDFAGSDHAVMSARKEKSDSFFPHVHCKTCGNKMVDDTPLNQTCPARCLLIDMCQCKEEK